MNTQTYILFGSTNPYQAQGNGLFRGRTLIVADVFYGTEAEASAKLMSHLCEECDEYHRNDAGDVVIATSYNEDTDTETTDVIASAGSMAYEHDGYVWTFVSIDELDENQAAVALNSGRLNDTEVGEVYAVHPDLRPVEEAAGE